MYSYIGMSPDKGLHLAVVLYTPNTFHTMVTLETGCLATAIQGTPPGTIYMTPCTYFPMGILLNSSQYIRQDVIDRGVQTLYTTCNSIALSGLLLHSRSKGPLFFNTVHVQCCVINASSNFLPTHSCWQCWLSFVQQFW